MQWEKENQDLQTQETSTNRSRTLGRLKPSNSQSKCTGCGQKFQCLKIRKIGETDLAQKSKSS